MWTPYPVTHTHILAFTHKHPHTRPSWLLPHQNLWSKGYHLHQEAEKQPLLFSFRAASPPPQLLSLSPPLCPHSPKASKAGRGSGGPLTSAPLQRGPALGYPYPQLLLVSSAGREGWRGPADSSQMLTKCSYVITVFSILPPRPL